MLKSTLVLLSLFSASVAFSAESRCQSAVEKQMPDLSHYAYAVPESKANIIDRIMDGDIRLKRADERPVINMLRRKGTLAFSFDLKNEGVYLTIVSTSNYCVVLYVARTLKFKI